MNEYSNEKPANWTDKDILAMQRALQVYIESFIGLARYLVQQKYHLSVSKSREALDELKIRQDINLSQHNELLKIIGFRNVLVHDYLDINDTIMYTIIIQQRYLMLNQFILHWQQELNLLT